MNSLPCDPVELARTLFADAADAIFLFDGNSGQILDANPAALQLAATPLDRLLTQTIDAIVESSPSLLELLRRPEGLGAANDFQLRRGDGRLAPVRLSVRVISPAQPIGVLRVEDQHRKPWKQTEADLIESQHRFELFMNTIPVVGFMIDALGQLVYVNRAMCQALDRSKEQLLGRTAYDLFPPDVAHTLLKDDLRVLAGTTAAEGPVFVPAPNGVLRKWWIVRFPFRDSRGQAFMGAIALDLSEHAKLEVAVRHSEERYRQLWQRNLAGGFRAGADGRILDCNDSFARLFGFPSRADALKRSTQDLYFDVAVRAEFLTHLRKHRYLANYEMQMRRADGAPICVLENVSLLTEDGQEILEGTIIDISDRKRIEEALRASENNYRTLINHLDQAIFLKDRELRYVAVNPVFCAGVGKTESELRGKTIAELFPAHAVIERSREIEKRVLERGCSIETEDVFKIRGQPRNVRVNRTPVKSPDGTVVGVLGICWDVTEQRELEAQVRHVQKMEAIGQLAGGIAHDFNNLLTIMLGNLSYFLAQSGNEQFGLDLIRNAERAGLRAAELTQTLLGFSRRAAVAMVPVDLNQAVAEVVRLTRSSLPPNIEIDVQAEPNLWLVEADAGHVDQALTNLTLNARDAMPAGGKITYRTSHFRPDQEYLASHVEARPGEFVRMRIEDTGAGIAPDVRDRIFEPFFTTKEKGKGTGLGLAVVFSIVKQHRGWIVCESALAHGTAFELFLPRCTTPVVEPAKNGGAPTAAPLRETILVVDDEAMIRQLAKTILLRAGYQVLVAENGAVALELLQEHPNEIALVVLDAVMPRLSGRDTLNHMARVAPDVAVLFSSGYSTEQMGLHEFPQIRALLPKPYRAEQLVDKVAEILHEARRTSSQS